MKKGIYRLYTKTDNKTFYIGRSINIERRLQEHIRNAKSTKNQELKYQTIRELYNQNQEWKIELIDANMDNEDYHIYQALLNKQPLTNMCKGSIYTIVESGAKYDNPMELNDAIIKSENNNPKLKKPISLKKYKKDFPITDTRFQSELGSSKPPITLSEGTRRLMARRTKKR